MPITKLHFTNVGPFEDIEFDFDKQVNVITGPNNSGKSTVLWVLAEILVYPFFFPSKLYRDLDAKFEIQARIGNTDRSLEGLFPIKYDEGEWVGQKKQKSSALMADLGYTNYLPALRQSTDFRATGANVERESPSRTTRRRRAHEEVARREALFPTDALLVSDEAIIEKMVELDYRAYRRDQPSIRGLIDKVLDVASDITEGFPLHFMRIEEDDEGLFPQINTPDGDVPLNVLSQGTQSLIQWIGHFVLGYAQYYDYPDELETMPGILIIDEIDAHLHPSWQRQIIPTLVRNFPKLQIFCSTHSPLMLAGLKEGQVQLLRRDEKGQVAASRNETDIIGWSADEILRNFLDVSSPTIFSMKRS